MTSKDLLNLIKAKFNENNIDNAENEAYFIMETALSLSKTDLILKSDVETTESETEFALKAAENRISGMPLQYCIGEWDFYGETYMVGKGVLIPRPETEELCETAIDMLKGRDNPIVIDLCSGSGCIGLTIKKNVPSSKVYLVEKSEDALCYLLQNAERICNDDSVSIIKADVLVFDGTLPKADLIVSNPPYIMSDEIEFLQKEVQFEPRMALDGGKDGYDFYRFICKEWQILLKDDGIMAFECGENQAQTISHMFDHHFFDTEIKTDFNGVERFVIGRKKHK